MKLRQGIYKGFVDERGIQTWLGISYAKPLVGKLRWHAPEKLDASNKTFDAKNFGYSPMQEKDEIEYASLLPQSEDCLMLNIWSRGVENKKPVIVFIHGGSFIGGDPDNVTVFGESAGAASCFLLMLLPQAKGLFNKVISQSGHLTFYKTFEQSAELARKFMTLGGYKNMRELMKKTAEELCDTYEKLCEENFYSTDLDYFPTCDGKFLPEHPFKALADGAASDVKLLTGTNADEYRYWSLYFENFEDNIEDYHATITPYFYESEFTNAAELYQSWQAHHEGADYLEFANQIDWHVGQELAAEYQSRFNDVYFYLFSQASPDKNLSACHAAELPFVFGNVWEEVDPNPPANLIEQVHATWIAFAKSGNPNNASIPLWKKYTADDRETMEINSKAWTLHKDLNADNLNELRAVYEERLLD